MNALIGYTGFVGSNINEKMGFEYHYNSKNIGDIINYQYDLVVSSGLPSLKWYANKNPEEDLNNIKNLINHLKQVKCNRFVLISTSDVYANTSNNPNFVKCDKTHIPYGYNRYYAEQEIEKIFGDKLTIIRLPMLFGNNLKKNVLYDLINKDLFKPLNLCDTYQWYDVRDLVDDINFALDNQLLELNLFTEPISMNELVDKFFDVDPKELYYNCDTAVKYNLKCNLDSFTYWKTKREIILRLKQYLI